MAMVFQFKPVLLRDADLGFLNLRVLKLHNSFTLAADQVIVVGLGTPAFIVGVAACAETLRDHPRLKKDWEISVDRIP